MTTSTRRPDDPLRCLPCDEALDLLEPCLDGDLTPEESARLRVHLEGCAACAAELALAGRVQAGLRALPQPDCPPELIARVVRTGRGEVVAFPGRVRTLRTRFAAAAAVAALAVGGGSLFVHLQHLQQRAASRQAQVAEATREARFALACIGRATRKAGLDVRDEVLQKRLVTPAAQTLSRLSNDLPNASSPAGEPRQEP
jgi:anti-sigma factor (TIGR02949 family)